MATEYQLLGIIRKQEFVYYTILCLRVLIADSYYEYRGFIAITKHPLLKELNIIVFTKSLATRLYICTACGSRSEPRGVARIFRKREQITKKSDSRMKRGVKFCMPEATPTN